MNELTAEFPYFDPEFLARVPEALTRKSDAVVDIVHSTNAIIQCEGRADD